MMGNDGELDTPELDKQEGAIAQAEVPEDEVSDDAEGEEDTEVAEEEGSEEAAQEVEQRSRASSRIQALRTREREAQERAERAEQGMAALRRQMEDVQRQINSGSNQREAQAEAELLAQLDPVQRVQYEADKKFKELNSQLQQVRMSALDSQDKAEFLSKSQSDPVRSRLVADVEKTLAEMRSKGLNSPREDIYYYLLGKSFAEQKAKSGGKSVDKRAAQDRVDATQGRTTSVRGDASSGRKGKTAEDRLDGVIL